MRCVHLPLMLSLSATKRANQKKSRKVNGGEKNRIRIIDEFVQNDIRVKVYDFMCTHLFHSELYHTKFIVCRRCQAYVKRIPISVEMNFKRHRSK